MKYVICLLATFLAVASSESTPRWNPLGCGKSPHRMTQKVNGKDPKIVGGQTALPNEFPWQVSLQSSGSHFCGASVISDHWILCAAHCTYGSSPGSITAVAGEHHRSESDGTEQYLSISAIYNHENYSPFGSDWDISLLYTTSAISIDYDGQTIYPVCEPTGTDFDGMDAIVSGWGTLRSGGLILPQELQFTTVPILAQDICILRYGSAITDNMICAGGAFESETDACQGDSGGPLVIYNAGTEEYELVGIVSWGYGCASGYPGVYTRVTQFLDWISGITGL